MQPGRRAPRNERCVFRVTPGARLAAAIEILATLDAGTVPADDVAADYFRRRRYIGAKDRAAVAGQVYGVLRHRAQLDWWIGGEGGGAVAVGARSRVLAAAILLAGASPEALSKDCDGDRFRPASLDRAEARLLRRLAGRTLGHPAMPRAVANDIPDWLEPHLERVFGGSLEREMAAAVLRRGRRWRPCRNRTPS